MKSRERERDVARFSVVIQAHAMWKFDNRRINNFCMGRLEWHSDELECHFI